MYTEKLILANTLKASLTARRATAELEADSGGPNAESAKAALAERRHPDSVQGFLTKEEVDAHARHPFGTGPVIPKDVDILRRLRNAISPYGYRGFEYSGGALTGGVRHRAFCIWDDGFERTLDSLEAEYAEI